MTAAERLMLYFADWRENQVAYDCQGRRLAVKLSAEVANGSLRFQGYAGGFAVSLYNLWLGASVMVKIERPHEPFEGALRAIRRILAISQA